MANKASRLAAMKKALFKAKGENKAEDKKEGKKGEKAEGDAMGGPGMKCSDCGATGGCGHKATGGPGFSNIKKGLAMGGKGKKNKC